MVLQTNSNPKSDQIFTGGGGTLDQLKYQVPSPNKIFIFRGEGFTLDTTFLKYWNVVVMVANSWIL